MARTSLAERQARLEQHRARLQAEEARIRAAERKARSRHLIEAAGLIEKAALQDLEPDALYGALLSLRGQAADPGQVQRRAQSGRRMFARERQATECDRQPLILTFATPPPADVSTVLRAHGFRWSKVMPYWESLAAHDAAAFLAQEHDGVLTRARATEEDLSS